MSEKFNRSRPKKLLLQSSIVALMASGHFAYAQQNDAEATVQEAETSSVEEKEIEQFEEVIVTGQKVERSLQDTAASVSVTTVDDINDYTINDLKDVFTKTANVVSTNGDSGFTIRGISNTNVTGAGISDLATVYIDGAPMPRDFVQSGSAGVWDVAQVEVLRGPQSTLQGRNSLAGAVIVNTANPTYDWDAKMQVQAYDKNAERRAAFAVGGPILEDQVAFRVAAQIHNEDGFIYNETRQEYASEASSNMFRAKLLIEPVAVPDLSVLLTHVYDDREGPQTFSFLDSKDSSWSDRKIYSSLEYKDDSKLNLTIADVSYDFSDELSLTSITTYNEVKRSSQRDNDYLPQENRYAIRTAKPKTLTQEFRWNFSNDYVSTVFGAYYSKFDNKKAKDESLIRYLPAARVARAVANPLLGLTAAQQAAVVGLYQAGFNLGAVSIYPQEVETKALFADTTWYLGDSIRLLAGLRYDKEKQNRSSSQEVEIVTPLPVASGALAPLAPIVDILNSSLIDAVTRANTAGEKTSTDFDAFLPKLGVVGDVAENASLGFVIQRGYRSGGADINAAQAKMVEFDPEYTWNYELSWRSQWFDNRLTVNANMFYVDWKDQQVTVFLDASGYDSETRNAGKSHLYGAELELGYVVNNGFDIYASLGHTKTEFDEFVTRIKGEDKDLSGNAFGNAPKYTIGLGSSWLSESGLFISIDARYGSKRFSRADADQSEKENILSERTIVNAKVGYRTDNFGIYLVGTNLFDEEYIDTTFTHTVAGVDEGTVGRYGQPRLFGLTIEAQM